MKYQVNYLPGVFKTLQKMDGYTRRIIVSWIGKNLVDCENPRTYGKPLMADNEEQWRYRVGDYRIIAKIEDDRLVILVITIAHRKIVYQK